MEMTQMTAKSIAQEVTDRILDQLKAGVCPWKQPWTSTGSGLMPRNHVTGRAYSGINVLLLWIRAQDAGVQSAGISARKGDG